MTLGHTIAGFLKIQEGCQLPMARARRTHGHMGLSVVEGPPFLVSKVKGRKRKGTLKDIVHSPSTAFAHVVLGPVPFLPSPPLPPFHSPPEGGGRQECDLEL